MLLELAPVDPRSLMQGDYMALRFKVAREVFTAQSLATLRDGNLVLGVDDHGVATYRRLDDGGAPLAADEVRLRFRIRNGAPKFAGRNAFFFEEGARKNTWARATASFGLRRMASPFLPGCATVSAPPLAHGREVDAVA